MSRKHEHTAKTPVCDFIKQYAESGTARFHMPGHKGRARLGFEPYDLTEFDGADDLFEPEGIIAESEAEASRLFGCRTQYSAGGSTLMIQAMLALAVGKGGRVAAGRNAHKSLLNTAVLLDLQISWLYPSANASANTSANVAANASTDTSANASAAAFANNTGTAISECVCLVTAGDVEKIILSDRPKAVYLTSPDYLGNVAEIEAIAEVCHRHGVWLLVDNAHGAYLKFLKPSQHPMDLGADICCDSAHKTLPVITGGLYLHFSDRAANAFPAQTVKDTMALFGSTSPSYLIIASLDAANPYLEQLPEKLEEFIPKVDALKKRLTEHGWTLVGTEPLKITLSARDYGYTGDELAELLLPMGIVSEFHDQDFIVFMATPENSDEDLERLESALTGTEIARREWLYQEASGITQNGPILKEASGITQNGAISKETSGIAQNGAISKETSGIAQNGILPKTAQPHQLTSRHIPVQETDTFHPVIAMSPRDAWFAQSETLPVEQACGRILSSARIGCPPAVPIVMAGEVIDENAIARMRYYGITECKVVREHK